MVKTTTEFSKSLKSLESLISRNIPSVNFNNRPLGEVDLLVIHCASLPEGEYNNTILEELFSGAISPNTLLQLGLAGDLQVSTHLYIKRDGEIIQFVPLDKRAWHAGQSEFQGRTNCNDFSIGIELQGTVTTEFTQAQYVALIKLTKIIMDLYPKITPDRIVGHSVIAPSRKQDPGVKFNWQFYLANITSNITL